MQFLVFQLQASLAAWGDVAVGEYRGSRDAPGASALIGLLGAALGAVRDDEAAHAALRDGYLFAVGTVTSGQLLRDYHTAQVPGRAQLKGRPHHTRRDELNLPKHELNTILSTRDYRQNAAWAVAVQAHADAPHILQALAQALREPRFVLYLGRKCCPPAAPLAPTAAMTSVSSTLSLYDKAFTGGRFSPTKATALVRLRLKKACIAVCRRAGIKSSCNAQFASGICSGIWTSGSPSR